MAGRGGRCVACDRAETDRTISPPSRQRSLEQAGRTLERVSWFLVPSWTLLGRRREDVLATCSAGPSQGGRDDRNSSVRSATTSRAKRDTHLSSQLRQRLAPSMTTQRCLRFLHRSQGRVTLLRYGLAWLIRELGLEEEEGQGQPR
jgi:hypothetical protein